MRTIFNEGRVVGASAYELYARQMLADGADPISEREYLSATIGWGNSMILRIEAGTVAGYHDYVLPEKSDLCGCTVLFASVFEGAVALDSTKTWGTEVLDYGRLIANNDISHPETPGEPENIPVNGDVTTHSPEFIRQCEQYNKITAGLMFQPGEWNHNITYKPLLTEDTTTDTVIFTQDYDILLANVPFNPTAGTMALKPDMSKLGFVRIAFAKDVTEDFYILLTGLNLRSIMSGVSGYKDPYTGTSPWNGDFLGPQVYPWAAKIVFTVGIDSQRVAIDTITNTIDEILNNDAQSVFDSTDFNKFTRSGFYNINTINRYSHKPATAVDGQLYISSNESTVSQLYVDLNQNCWQRCFEADSQSIPGWTKLATSTDISNLETSLSQMEQRLNQSITNVSDSLNSYKQSNDAAISGLDGRVTALEQQE